MHRESQSLAAARVWGVERRGGGSRHQRTESTMDGSWSQLPSELLERVLPYLPVPDLCRLRSVCKRWNSLITTPEFGGLCIQNASNSTNNGACLVVKLRLYSSQSCRPTELPSWSIFDFNARRWYNIKHGLPEGYDYDVPAMDAGLVCTFVTAFTEEQRRTSTIHNCMAKWQPQTLIVSNLIGKTIKALPNPPLPHIELPWTNLRLVVDKTSQTYKIFLICVGFTWIDSRYRCMCVYESATDQWRIAPNPPNPNLPGPSNLPGPHAEFGAHVRSVIFRGLLYVLFSAKCRGIYRLYSYDFEEDAWEDTGVQFWTGPQFWVDLDLCDLVVSDNRLFLMAQRVVDRSLVDRPYFRSNKEEMGHRGLPTCPMPFPLDISEILLAEKVRKTVVRMTETELFHNFDVQRNDVCRFKVRAFGFDKSIVLTLESVHGRTGKYMMYNLGTGSWEFLPPNPAECLDDRGGSNGRLSRHGKHMSFLRLPNTPWG